MSPFVKPAGVRPNGRSSVDYQASLHMPLPRREPAPQPRRIPSPVRSPVSHVDCECRERLRVRTVPTERQERGLWGVLQAVSLCSEQTQTSRLRVSRSPESASEAVQAGAAWGILPHRTSKNKRLLKLLFKNK